jgi:ElaB/YqjD/DUF883 family membrane-anchored ribosome-binding protein
MKTTNAMPAAADPLIAALAEASTDELAVVWAERDAGFGELGDSLNDARLALLKQATHASEATQDYLQENPWRFLGAVAVAGIVIGVLLSRR